MKIIKLFLILLALLAVTYFSSPLHAYEMQAVKPQQQEPNIANRPKAGEGEPGNEFNAQEPMAAKNRNAEKRIPAIKPKEQKQNAAKEPNAKIPKVTKEVMDLFNCFKIGYGVGASHIPTRDGSVPYIDITIADPIRHTWRSVRHIIISKEGVYDVPIVEVAAKPSEFSKLIFGSHIVYLGSQPEDLDEVPEIREDEFPDFDDLFGNLAEDVKEPQKIRKGVVPVIMDKIFGGIAQVLTTSIASIPHVIYSEADGTFPIHEVELNEFPLNKAKRHFLKRVDNSESWNATKAEIIKALNESVIDFGTYSLTLQLRRAILDAYIYSVTKEFFLDSNAFDLYRMDFKDLDEAKKAELEKAFENLDEETLDLLLRDAEDLYIDPRVAVNKNVEDFRDWEKNFKNRVPDYPAYKKAAITKMYNDKFGADFVNRCSKFLTDNEAKAIIAQFQRLMK